MIPLAAPGPYDADRRFASRVFFSAFFGHPTFPARHRTFPPCTRRRVARSRAFPAGDAIDRTGQFNLPIASREFVRITTCLSPIGRRTGRNRRRTQSADWFIVSLGQATRRPGRRTRRNARLSGRIAHPVGSTGQFQSPAGQPNRRSITNLIFARSTECVAPASARYRAPSRFVSRAVDPTGGQFIQRLGRMTRQRERLSSPGWQATHPDDQPYQSSRSGADKSRPHTAEAELLAVSRVLLALAYRLLAAGREP